MTSAVWARKIAGAESPDTSAMPPAVFNTLRRVNWLFLDISLRLPDTAARSSSFLSGNRLRSLCEERLCACRDL
jgi:hypothetical protein